MEILWKEHPFSANQIIKRLAKTNWAANTMRTLLARLSKKKILTSSREECVQGERVILS